MKRTKLKGGSLSGTYLVEPDVGTPFVRKDVSLTVNREYGFQRWYSQLKRLQRYGELFPGVFPQLLDYGMERDDLAYFDLEFIPAALTIQEYLMQPRTDEEVDDVLRAFTDMMGRIHSQKIRSTPNALPLYIHEEIEVKIAACHANPKFRDILEYDEIIFNGRPVRPLARCVDELKRVAKSLYQNTDECFTHGNITLENVLYQPATKRVVFIDPYEENVIDSVLAEYSQVYQSSHAKYEVFNEGEALVDKNHVSMSIPPTPGLDVFDEKFTRWVKKNHNDSDFTIIRILEVSQFARMLPFKMAIDESKMLFFYGLASSLWHDLQGDF